MCNFFTNIAEGRRQRLFLAVQLVFMLIARFAGLSFSATIIHGGCAAAGRPFKKLAVGRCAPKMAGVLILLKMLDQIGVLEESLDFDEQFFQVLVLKFLLKKQFINQCELFDKRVEKLHLLHLSCHLSKFHYCYST